MKLNYAIKAVAAIEAAKGDDEVAHGMEDDLYYQFAVFVADSGIPEVSDIAKEIIKTADIKFSRWCA